MPSLPSSTLTRLRDRLLPFAIGLLLLSQTLALVHRVAHAPVPAGHGVASAPAHGHVLFGDHSSTDCRLFDQAAPTDLAPLPVAAAALSFAPAAAPAASEATPLAARLRAFRARDPPLPLA